VVHYSHRLIAISLVTVILLPCFPAIFDEGQVISQQLTSSLALINFAFNGVPGNPAADCKELRAAVDNWYFAYYLPVSMPELIKLSYNDQPLEFLLSAQVLPVRCPFQVGKYGTIANPSCPPSATHAIGDLAACQNIIKPFDDAIDRGDYTSYFNLMTGGTTLRQTAQMSSKCEGRGGKKFCEFIEWPSFAFEGGFDPAQPSKKVVTLFNFTATIQFGAILGLIGRTLLLIMLWIFSGVLQVRLRFAQPLILNSQLFPLIPSFAVLFALHRL
jgi:hypothetical protein